MTCRVPTKIHITGASGSGTTTLGRALAHLANVDHFDTDDYFWEPSDPPFSRPRLRDERIRLLQHMEFMNWASQYDIGDESMRSLRFHEKWLARLQCPVLRLNGELATSAQVERVLEYAGTQ